MRGLINAVYVSMYQELPLIDFNKQLEIGQNYDEIGDMITKKLIEIIAQKRGEKEKDEQQPIKLFDDCIENFLRTEKQVESKRIKDYSTLQIYINYLLGEK